MGSHPSRTGESSGQAGRPPCPSAECGHEGRDDEVAEGEGVDQHCGGYGEAEVRWGVESNHGGRQLDSAPGAFAALPRIADAVGDRAEMPVDGGCQRDADVVKARALGARAAQDAMGGRSWFCGLAAAGEKGARRMLDIFGGDMDRALALVGRSCFDGVGPDLVA